MNPMNKLFMSIVVTILTVSIGLTTVFAGNTGITENLPVIVDFQTLTEEQKTEAIELLIEALANGAITREQFVGMVISIENDETLELDELIAAILTDLIASLNVPMDEVSQPSNTQRSEMRGRFDARFGDGFADRFDDFREGDWGVFYWQRGNRPELFDEFTVPDSFSGLLDEWLTRGMESGRITDEHLDLFSSMRGRTEPFDWGRIDSHGRRGEIPRVNLGQGRHQLDSYADVYEMVKNSVVSINTISEVMQQEINIFNIFGPRGGMIPNQPPTPREARGAGSGIIIYEDDEHIYIVTNYHVIANAHNCSISLDDETQVPARFIGGDAFTDIAVIAVNKADMAEAGKKYQVATFGSSGAMRMGDQVMAVGNALGEGKSITVGVISAVNRQITIESNTYTVLQTDAAINRGNSGGPLVNMRGEVIGINVAKLASNTVEGTGFAIPIDEVIEIIDNIISEQGSIIRPFLGISGSTLLLNDYDNEFELDLPESGALVNSVVSGFLAQEMGIRRGDIIIQYNGVDVTGMEQLRGLIEQTEIGAEIEIEVVRITYRNTQYGSIPSGTENHTFTGVMKNYTTDPEF